MSEAPKYTAIYIKENEEGYYAEGNSARLISFIEPSYSLLANGKTGVKVLIEPDNLFSLLQTLDEFSIDYQVKDDNLNITHEQHFKRNNYEFFFKNLTDEISLQKLEENTKTIETEKPSKKEKATKNRDTYDLNKSDAVTARIVKNKGTYLVSFISDDLDTINRVLDDLDEASIMPSIKELK